MPLSGSAERSGRQAMEGLYGPDKNTSPEQPRLRSWLTGYLLPLGSVLIAALALLSQHAQLPRWAIMVAAGYLVVVAGVSLFRPAQCFLSFVRSRLRLRRLAKTHSPRLSENVKVLGQFLERGNSNSLLYAIWEAAQWEELKGQSPIIDTEHVETFRTWFSSIRGHAKRCRADEFERLCGQVGLLIHEYNRFCCQRLRALQTQVAAGRLPEQRSRQLKQQWNSQRDGHTAFLREWASFAKRVNQAAGRQVCPDYYEPVATLE